MKLTFPMMALLAIAWIASPASAAILSTGYTPGGSSQLLSANGGGGDTLFVDSVILGGESGNDFNYTVFDATSVLLPGTGLWNIGDTVSITGVALVLRNTTSTGTITIDIRQGAGGIGASGAGALSSLGTTTASYTTGATSVRYANFDSPITFVADANSTTIGINLSNSGSILSPKRWNINDGFRLAQYNKVNGNLVGKFLAFSVAGTVTEIPEPATLLLGAMNLVAMAVYRGRWI